MVSGDLFSLDLSHLQPEPKYLALQGATMQEIRLFVNKFCFINNKSNCSLSLEQINSQICCLFWKKVNKSQTYFDWESSNQNGATFIFSKIFPISWKTSW